MATPVLRRAALVLVALGTLVAAPVRAASATADAEGLVRIIAVGDLSFSYGVGRAIGRHRLDPLVNVRKVLADADLTFGNLEVVLSARPVPKLIGPVYGPILQGPGGAADLLATAGFDVVSVANNHAFDLHEGGQQDTLAHLLRVGVTPVGGGATREAAHSPVIRQVSGLRIGLLAYTINTNRTVRGPAYVARIEDASVAAVQALRAKVDVLLISLHWGTELVAGPSTSQVQLAHQLIDAGADAIIGHHPHVLQSVEVYRGRAIAYSLGNFVFGPQPLPRNQSAILELELHAGTRPITRVTLVPVLLQGEYGNPTPVRGPEGNGVRQRLLEVSRRFRTRFLETQGALELVLDPS